jgi:hypothetical protein
MRAPSEATRRVQRDCGSAQVLLGEYGAGKTKLMDRICVSNALHAHLQATLVFVPFSLCLPAILPEVIGLVDRVFVQFNESVRSLPAGRELVGRSMIGAS